MIKHMSKNIGNDESRWRIYWIFLQNSGNFSVSLSDQNKFQVRKVRKTAKDFSSQVELQ